MIGESLTKGVVTDKEQGKVGHATEHTGQDCRYASTQLLDQFGSHRHHQVVGNTGK